MCQEATLAIKGTAVAVEALGEEEHDVGKVLDLVPYVAIGDLAEPQRGYALPDFEGFPDGLVGLILAHFGCIVLYTEEREKARDREWRKKDAGGKRAEEHRIAGTVRESRAKEKEIQREGEKGKKGGSRVIYITDKSPRNLGLSCSSVGILQYTKDYFSMRTLAISYWVSTSTTVKIQILKKVVISVKGGHFTLFNLLVS